MTLRKNELAQRKRRQWVLMTKMSGHINSYSRSTPRFQGQCHGKQENEKPRNLMGSKVVWLVTLRFLTFPLLPLFCLLSSFFPPLPPPFFSFFFFFMAVISHGEDKIREICPWDNSKFYAKDRAIIIIIMAMKSKRSG